MRLAVALLASLAITASAQAQIVQYGAASNDLAYVHSGGEVPLLLMHESGHTYTETETIAGELAREGFTVLNLEWHEGPESQPWAFLTGEIEEAVHYVQAHAQQLRVTPGRLVMLGGSRGANLALLTAMNMNAAVPGTVKAIAALSGDADPAEMIERAQRGETSERIAAKLSTVYGCEPVLVNCPASYIEEWSPMVKAAPSSPAAFLAASEADITATVQDDSELAEKLEGLGVASEARAVRTGHGFSYWSKVHAPVARFLAGRA
jgi:acetyl esterase/lipase